MRLWAIRAPASYSRGATNNKGVFGDGLYDRTVETEPLFTFEYFSNACTYSSRSLYTVPQNEQYDVIRLAVHKVVPYSPESRQSRLIPEHVREKTAGTIRKTPSGHRRIASDTRVCESHEAQIGSSAVTPCYIRRHPIMLSSGSHGGLACRSLSANEPSEFASLPVRILDMRLCGNLP